MAPLFFALASSFNVELVYIILKGITQFSYYNRQEAYMEKKRKKLLFTLCNQDIVLQLNQIKVKDLDKWRDM